MSMEEEVKALRAVPLLRDVDLAKLRLLAFISERMVFRPGENLCVQGDMGDRAFIILKGSANVIVNTDAGPKIVANVGQNDIVGEIAILCDVPRTATVAASDDGEVHALTVSKEHLFKLIREFPEMAFEIMRVLAQRLERTTRDLAVVRGELAQVQKTGSSAA